MLCELQPSMLPVQLLVPLSLQGPEQMQVQLQVLVQVSKPLLLPVPVRLVVPLLLPEMVLLVELVPVSEQVPVSMSNPPVDQPNPLMRSVPNPQLDQAELLLLSVLEQVPSEKVPVLDPLLKVVRCARQQRSCLVCYDQLSNLTRLRDRDPVFSPFLLNTRRTNCGVFVKPNCGPS